MTSRLADHQLSFEIEIFVSQRLDCLFALEQVVLQLFRTWTFRAVCTAEVRFIDVSHPVAIDHWTSWRLDQWSCWIARLVGCLADAMAWLDLLDVTPVKNSLHSTCWRFCRLSWSWAMTDRQLSHVLLKWCLSFSPDQARRLPWWETLICCKMCDWL